MGSRGSSSTEAGAVRLSNVSYFIQQCFRSLIRSYTARTNFSDMSHTNTELGIEHDLCYTPTKMGTVTEGSSSMQTSAMRLLNFLLD